MSEEAISSGDKLDRIWIRTEKYWEKNLRLSKNSAWRAELGKWAVRREKKNNSRNGDGKIILPSKGESTKITRGARWCVWVHHWFVCLFSFINPGSVVRGKGTVVRRWALLGCRQQLGNLIYRRVISTKLLIASPLQRALNINMCTVLPARAVRVTSDPQSPFRFAVPIQILQTMSRSIPLPDSSL